MPIIKIEKGKNYDWGLWKIEETVDDLLKDLKLTDIEKKRVSVLQNINRKKQNITARLLLNHLAKKKVELNYSDAGVPFCGDFNYISISHSNNYCMVATSDEKIGIDIQYFKEGIQKLSLKYMNTQEILYANNNIMKLHFIWSAKEAIYKTLNGAECSFKEDIYIENVKKNKITNGYYLKNQKNNYNIYCKVFNKHSIAIATIK